MSEWFAWILGIVIFLLVLSFSIALHEAGHMLVARRLGISVPKFFVGFGPTLWSRARGSTEYGVKAFPLGGFVKIEDETQPVGSAERGLLSFVKPWKRILIFIAGPVVNIILGVVILVSMMMFTPVQSVTTQISSVDSCVSFSNCGAAVAGFLPGDVVVSIDGREISTVSDLSSRFSPNGSNVVVDRDGVRVPLWVVAGKTGKIGVKLEVVERQRSFSESVGVMGSLLWLNLEALADVPGHVPNIVGSVFGGVERSPEGPSSILGVGKTYGDTAAEVDVSAESKLVTLLTYSGLFNLGLGFANLLPLLPLDGGHVVVALVDSVRKRWSRVRRSVYSPLPYKWVSVFTVVTGSLLVAFMLLVAVADIVSPLKV